MVNQLFDQLVSRQSKTYYWAANIMLALARFYSETDPSKSVTLLKLLDKNNLFIRLVDYKTGLSLDQTTVWACSSSSTVNNLRSEILDSASSDYFISQHVFAALAHNNSDFLKKYIDNKLSLSEPYQIARGLMVLGFSDYDGPNSDRLDSYAKYKGLVGSAYGAAKYAYERNHWARIWWQKMRSANNKRDFWQAQVLFLRIADQRFMLWREQFDSQSELFEVFGHTATEQLDARFKNWKKDREKTLFGRKLSDEIFLSSSDYRL